MADSALRKLRRDVMNDPAADRLKQELRAYLRARLRHTAGSLGRALADPRQSSDATRRSLARAREVLRKGGSPARAVLTAGVTLAGEKSRELLRARHRRGGGTPRSITITEDIDVGVPLPVAYKQWTRFQETRPARPWQVTVTERVSEERIAWTAEGARASVRGVATFHSLTGNLTRVLLVLEYVPKGVAEKAGALWRAQARRARLELRLYRSFVTTGEGHAPARRGELQGGGASGGKAAAKAPARRSRTGSASAKRSGGGGGGGGGG